MSWSRSRDQEGIYQPEGSPPASWRAAHFIIITLISSLKTERILTSSQDGRIKVVMDIDLHIVEIHFEPVRAESRQIKRSTIRMKTWGRRRDEQGIGAAKMKLK
jgi:hypothetical protein